jgi:hypothetical protein
MRHTILFHCWPVLRDCSFPRGQALYIIVLIAMLPNSQNSSQCAGRAAYLQEPSGEAERAGCNLPGGKITNVIFLRVSVVSLFGISTVPYYPLTLFRTFVTGSDESG